MSETTTPESVAADAVTDTGAANATTTEQQVATPETAAPAGSADAADDAGADPDAPKGRGGFQKRISELTAARRETERDRDYWRDMAMRTHAQPPQQPTPAGPTSLPADLVARVGTPPRPEDFPQGEYDPKYIAAVARHDILSEAAREVATQRDAAQRRAAMERTARISTSWQEKAAQAAASYPDFADVVMAPDVPVTEDMAEIMAELDGGAHVAYYLGKNPAEARRIASLSPKRQAAAIGQIEARLAGQRRTAAVSAAPPPPSTVTGRGGSNGDWRQAPMSEFAKGYRREVLKRD